MNVLVIDDHYLIRRGFQGLLTSLSPPCKCLPANSLEEAEIVARSVDDIDIAFLDLGLPGCHGLEAVARFRDSFPKTPVVVVSGTVTAEAIHGSLELGARGFIPKATELDESVFEFAVRKILEEEQVYLPAEARTAGDAGLASGLRDAQSVFRLADREEEVFEMMMNGFPNKSIADVMNITEKGVKAHVTNIFRKAGVRTRTELIVKAFRLGVRAPVRRRKTLGEPRE